MRYQEGSSPFELGEPVGEGTLLGTAVFGLLIGWIAYHMLSKVDNYQVEILITLALVMGGYSLAGALHVSGPIAIVVAEFQEIGRDGASQVLSKILRDVMT